MKYSIIYHIAWLLTVLLTCGSCQEEWGETPLSGNTLTLQLQTSAITRAPEKGEDRFNENSVERVDVFFFNSNTSTETCLYAQTGLTPDGNTLQVQLDRTIIENKTYYIYVVANYDLVGVGEAVGKTLGNLQNTVLTTQWKDGYAEDGSSSMEDVIEQSLAMDGSTTISITDEGATGQVDLKRAMAKIMLYVTTEQNIEYNGMTYRPDNDHMFATMVYAVKRTDFSNNYQVKTGNVDAEGTVIESTSDYIIRMRRDYDSEHTEEVTIEGEDGTPGTYNRYEQVAPFYSYPNPEDTENRMESYLILCVPWIVTAGGNDGSYQSFNYYYRVPITGTDAPALLERNHYYKVNAHIGVLGSINPHEAVDIEANFEILNWFEMDIDADMQKYEYLVLSEYNSVMNNVDTLTISYASSSDLKMEGSNYWDDKYTRITDVCYTDYMAINFVENGTHLNNLDDFTLLNDPENHALTFIYNMPSDVYSRYTITVEVWNTDGVSTTWTIEQYPPIYIEGERAQGRVYVAAQYTTVNNSWYGPDYYYSEVEYNNHDLGSVQNPTSVDGEGNNRNYNNYNIYISALQASDGDYAIGDPRTEEQDDDLAMPPLQQYLSTREDTEAQRIIAPAFKIASSRGKTLPVTFDNAQRRCAAYQEDGYPAGRWRIPTEAEIEFIVGLSDRNKIPSLFDGTYWSASGRTYTNDEDGGSFSEDISTGSNAVRCVYDIWYWGEDDIEHDDRNQSRLTNDSFVWGDSTEGELEATRTTDLNN